MVLKKRKEENGGRQANVAGGWNFVRVGFNTIGFFPSNFFLKKEFRKKKKYFLEFFLNWRSTSRGCIRFSPSNVVRSLWGVSSLFGVKTRVMCNRRWGGGCWWCRGATYHHGPPFRHHHHHAFNLSFKIKPQSVLFFLVLHKLLHFHGDFRLQWFPLFFSFYY